MKKDYNEQLSHLAMIIHVGRLDGDVSEEEQAFVDVMAERLGVTTEDKLKLMTGEIKAELNIPNSEWDRVEQFHMCMIAASSSGDIVDDEVLWCRRLGLKLGLRGVALENAVNLFIKYHPEPVPLPEMLRVYQLGHN